eukprot:CAMPEP_0119271414 /NCGR_PEP_ID=MMETSP1329-20130426/8014_1 /TAXON_ID=114041 /ORGANISM="Genus nov. species nov., Strain RCC1024" /LENGTH=194 /DNA_ID=CAMNT_0007271463 /DNA_START=29 /DNA_END=610 /DNA_ORIENTATION=+
MPSPRRPVALLLAVATLAYAWVANPRSPRALSLLRRPSTAGAADVTAEASRVITISDDALTHIAKLREAETDGKEHLRMGVRAGGCSGMSYSMDMCSEEDITEDDHVEQWPGGFKVVIDPKSMLYLFGLELGYSNELIGGGFQFQNPNAEATAAAARPSASSGRARRAAGRPASSARRQAVRTRARASGSRASG